MAPQGSAVIQVIDMPGGGELAYAGGGPHSRKPGGVNILAAVLRRWWLVALVTVIVGAAGLLAGDKFVKPVWEGHAKLSYHDFNLDSNNKGPIKAIVGRAENLLCDRDIALLAAHDADLQAAFPRELKDRDLKDPVVQNEVVAFLKTIGVDVSEPTPGGEVVELIAVRPAANEARATADAFAKAFVQYCKDAAGRQSAKNRSDIEAAVKEDAEQYASLNDAITHLKVDNNFDQELQKNQDATKALTAQRAKLEEARIQKLVAERALINLQDQATINPKDEIERQRMIADEKAKDGILQTYSNQLLVAISDYEKLIGDGRKQEHPQVKAASDQIERLKARITERDTEISAKIDAKIFAAQKLQGRLSVAEATDKVNAAEALIKFYDAEIAKATDEARRLTIVKLQLEDLTHNLAIVEQHRHDDEVLMTQLREDLLRHPVDKSFEISATAIPQLKDDKTIKVKAAGIVGGLFLGILLALLVDKFDKRLRDPRDIEPMLGAPLLGAIPHIQEIKRIKGDQARNLIAEEFRIIRTQVLFGNPNLNYKTIAITSPAPGDGKTSLAVNLAIAIAKAGRRTLLIDCDLRKPDVHRVFNIPDSPGLAELIQGSHEPAAVIRKSEIDALDILAAGAFSARPSELLSRPELKSVLAALAGSYDHIVLDTAPILPVSDTHVIVGLVDGVICSFNAEVDRDTVAMCQEILRRSRANVIGSVMNQVKYRQSGSYHRGKSAYNSYYNSTRAPRGSAPESPEAVAVPTLVRPK